MNPYISNRSLHVHSSRRITPTSLRKKNFTNTENASEHSKKKKKAHLDRYRRWKKEVIKRTKIIEEWKKINTETKI